MAEPALILLVDDDDAILDVLAAALGQSGYRCERLSSGEACIARGVAGVDLAVVDVMLPGMDGHEVTRRLKEMARPEEFLPVVLITADSLQEPARGFAAGCDDFLAKPINLYELQARVRSLLARRQQHADLALAANKLRIMHRMKQDLAALLVHDLRNPLSALQGNLGLLSEELGGASTLVHEILRDCHQLAARALSLVGGLLDVEELEEGLLRVEPAEVAVASFARGCATHHYATVKARNLQLAFHVDESLRARFDVELIGRLLENLLDNAVRYAARGGRVEVVAGLEDGALVLRVGNDGPAVPAEERPRIFGRYYRIEARRAGARANRGLGLYFCRLAAEAHGGSIVIEERPELPTSFVVRLPQ